MSEGDGGPAFPVPNDADVNGRTGMSLRDYFACHLAHGQISSYSGDVQDDYKEIARRSFAIADAMLKERAK